MMLGSYCARAGSPGHPLVRMSVPCVWGWRWMALRMPLISAAMGMELMPLAAEFAALLRRHLLPSMVIVQHALALFGRQLLKAMEALQNLFAPLRRQGPEARVRLLKLRPALGRQLPPLMHRLQNLLTLLGRQMPELFVVALRGAAFRGRHLLPLAEVLQHPLALSRTEGFPGIVIALDIRALSRGCGFARRHRLGGSAMHQHCEHQRDQ